MITEVGEYIVGSYLKQILKCDFGRVAHHLWWVPAVTDSHPELALVPSEADGSKGDRSQIRL